MPSGTHSIIPLPLNNGCSDNWSWNQNDKSHDVVLYGPRHHIASFHPNWSYGTAGVRGTRILNGSRYYWEIGLDRIYGTSMMFGIATKKTCLHVDAYVNLLGEDNTSWGLSHEGLLWHNGYCRPYIDRFEEHTSTTIGLFFDGVVGTLTFFKDGASLGVAFTGLSEVEEPLYPIVCSTAAKTEMTLCVQKREFVNLQDHCRAVILNQLVHKEHAVHLNVPPRIKQYIMEE